MDCLLHLHKFKDIDPDDVVHDFKTKYCSSLCTLPRNAKWQEGVLVTDKNMYEQLNVRYF